MTKYAFLVLCMYRGHPNMQEYTCPLYVWMPPYGWTPPYVWIPHVEHIPLYVWIPPHVWTSAYVWTLPICLDPPVCLEKLDTPCVWTPPMFGDPHAWIPPYVWIHSYVWMLLDTQYIWMKPCLDIPPVCLDDKACFLCVVCLDAPNIFRHLPCMLG